MRRRKELRVFDSELIVKVVFDRFPADKKDSKDQQSEKQCEKGAQPDDHEPGLSQRALHKDSPY